MKKTLLLSLMVTALCCQSASALKIQMGSYLGSEFENTAHWQGSNIPPGEGVLALLWGGEMEFSSDYTLAEGHMWTSSPNAPPVAEDMQWGYLDTPTEKFYTGNELRFTLMTETGDFTQTPLTDENFSMLVDYVKVEYYPAGVSTNFDTYVVVQEAPYEIVPEPGSILMALMGAVCAVGRFMLKGSNYA